MQTKDKLALFGVTAALLVGPGCGGDDPGREESAGDVDVGKADFWGPAQTTSFEDEEPRPGETVTVARARRLSEYADRLIANWDPTLEATFARRGVEGTLLSETYSVRVEGGSCFSEERKLGGDYDISSDQDLQRMIRQVDYAVEFLARFHEDARGYPNRFFDSLALCPSRAINGDLVLQGRTLYVGVGVRFGTLHTQNAFEIRDAWSSGEHLGQHFPIFARVWHLLDPVGTARLVLREAISGAAGFLGERLAEIQQPDHREDSLRADLLELVEHNVIPEYQASEEVLFRDEATGRIADMDGSQLRQLAALWQDFLADSRNLEGMTEAVLATHQATATNAYDIDLEQRGLVVVGNFHHITVDVSVFLPRNRRFLQYVTIEKVEQDIRVRQYALVAVYTIDNVEVNLAVGADRGLETAGLEYALARISLGQ